MESLLDSYKNKDARENALRHIVEEMEITGLTVTDVKNKIKTIRTMYKKEHSLIIKSRKSGMGIDDIYVPKLFWYKRADLFLNGVTSTRDTSSNLNLHDETENETIEISASSICITTGNVDSQEEVIHLENKETDNPTPKKSKTTNVLRAPQSRKRKMVNDNISTVKDAIEKFDKVMEKNQNDRDDEFDVFGKFISLQLKRMPLYDAIISREEIRSVIGLVHVVDIVDFPFCANVTERVGRRAHSSCL